MRLFLIAFTLVLTVNFTLDALAQSRNYKKRPPVQTEDPIMISPHTLRNMSTMSNKERKRTMRRLERSYTDNETFTQHGTDTATDTREIFKVEAPHKEEMREEEQQERAQEERFAREVLNDRLLTNTQRERIMQKLERARDFNRRDRIGAFERFERDKKLAKSRVSAFRFDRSRQDAIERMEAYKINAFEPLTPRQKNRYYRDIRNVNINTRSYYDRDGNRINLNPKIDARISQFDRMDNQIARQIKAGRISEDVRLRNRDRLSGWGVMTKEQKDLSLKMDTFTRRNVRDGEFVVKDPSKGIAEDNVYKRSTERHVFADQGRVKMDRNKTIRGYTNENTVRDERMIPNMQMALGDDRGDRTVEGRYRSYTPSIGARIEQRLRNDRPDLDVRGRRMSPEEARQIYQPHTPRPLLSREMADKNEDPRELGPDRYVSRHVQPSYNQVNRRADARHNNNSWDGIPSGTIYLGGTRRQYEAQQYNSRAYQPGRFYEGPRY